MTLRSLSELLARTLTGTALMGLGLSAGSVLAQEGEEVEEITVTGSRIARDPNLGAPVSVQSVSGEDIRLSGKLDVTEIVREIPALITSDTGDSSADPSGSAFDTDNSSVFSAAGESVLALRGMGVERTLVLVDGRRHVGGSPGTSAVDINTIPQPLIERVEVLTGGASAIYGADAVTGVVNFIMKDDYDGFEINAQGGVSGEGDGEDYRLSGVWGKNFMNDRANFTVAVDYRKREPIRQRDRDWANDNARGSDDNNPALRFQRGEINGNTPNFQQFFSTAQGNFPFGQRIPTSADDFIQDYTDAFGSAPSLTSAEQALIDRAVNAPTRSIERFRTFSISSEGGVVVPGDFTFSGIDLNNNGNEDCLDSFLGWNSLLEGNAFGITGGCWNIDQGGVPRIYEDGRIAGNFNQFGGDGIHASGFAPNWITPDDERIVINLSGRYDMTDTVSFFAEAKFVDQSTDTFGVGTGFYDLLTVAPDNPFIPAALQPVADAQNGLFITRDPIDLGGSRDTVDREVSRFVLGMEGEFENGWGFEVSLNRGQTNLTNYNRGATIMDRYFAAIDVTTDGSGNPVCRSELDGSAAPTTIFDIPLFDFGFFTFNPGDGSCVPYNILNGPQGATQANIDWMMTTEVHEFKIEQTVFQALIDGELPFGFDAGNALFAAGTEFRTERSTSRFDALTRGVCPLDTPDCAAGQLVADAQGGAFRQTSLVFDPEFLVANSTGTYDVWELFAEFEVPLLEGVSGAEELTFNAAGRFSQYSNVGDTFTWQGSLVWAPVEDIRFRGAVSQAVRAPNVGELFDPEQATTFRPTDPCEQAEIDTLITNGDPRGPIRAANCLADGLPADFTDPLSARFSGVNSGNPALTEETADTLTVGLVFQPRFLEGFTASIDYWDIEIEDAIDFVDDQDIVDNCYDSSTFPNQFCSLLTRNRDPGSPQFLGLNFIRQTRLNFGKIQSSGIDFSARYAFEVGANAFDVSVQGTKVDELDEFFDPGDPTAVDPELGELRRPELAYSVSLGWGLGPFSLGWRSFYQDEQGLADVEIETADFTYGPAGFADEVWTHDLTANWQVNDNIQLFGGVNNVTDQDPFLTEIAWPVSPRGRYYFVGLNYVVE